MNRFDGKRALVTGAGSGIGRATAERLAAEGARVACVDLRGANEVAESIGGDALAFDCDVRDAEAVNATVDDAIAALGGLDITCNIAGIGHFRNSHEETPEDFARIVGVNLNGTFHVCRAVLPTYLEAGAGVIINTASTAGLMGQPWSAAYCASKGGVVMLTKALATEYADRNIRINAVAPGGTDTDIQTAFAESFPADANFKMMKKMMSPMGMATPAEMASAFAYIASDEARYMSGAILSMDGATVA
jgi:NAD(P)-dependent dehydrogenase (short-subunit alcohol dehydrogenase family)